MMAPVGSVGRLSGSVLVAQVAMRRTTSSGNSGRLSSDRRWCIALVSVAAAVAVLASSCGGGSSDVGSSDSVPTVSTNREPQNTTSDREPEATRTKAGRDATGAASSTTDPFLLVTFTPDDVTAAGYEAIGCWFHATGSDEPIFFAGYSGGFMVAGGVAVTLDEQPDAVEIDYGAVTGYSSERYGVAFDDLGERNETSHESSDRTATLVATEIGGLSIEVEGILGCGV